MKIMVNYYVIFFVTRLLLLLKLIIVAFLSFLSNHLGLRIFLCDRDNT